MSARGPNLGYEHAWHPRAGATRTLLLLHGTGGDEHDLVPLGDLIDPAANLLSPRGDVLENGMPRFFRRLGEGIFDLEDVRRGAAKLATFVRVGAARYAFDPAGLTAVGFSNGANIAAAVMLLHPGAIRGAVLIRAMVVIEPPARPDLAGARVLLSSGRSDPLMRPGEGARLAALLRGSGADVTEHLVDAGHQLTRADVDAARAWLSAAPSRAGDAGSPRAAP